MTDKTLETGIDETAENETFTKKEVDHILNEKQWNWSWSKFFISIPKLLFNMSFISWATYTTLYYMMFIWIMRFNNGETTIEMIIAILASTPFLIMTIGWVVISFVMAAELQKAVGAMIEKIKIEARAEAKIESKTNIDTSDVKSIVSAGGKNGN